MNRFENGGAAAKLESGDPAIGVRESNGDQDPKKDPKKDSRKKEDIRRITVISEEQRVQGVAHLKSTTRFQTRSDDTQG